LEPLLLAGITIIAWYGWTRRNERGLEEGKALTEMTARALEASGYTLTGWGEESRNRKTASTYPRGYEKEYTLDGVRFRSMVTLHSPERNRANISAGVYSGLNCYFNCSRGNSGINKLNELDIQTLAVRALQNYRANTPFNTVKPSKLY
jgi:hypothetical protein